jgi:hypothetical protein
MIMMNDNQGKRLSQIKDSENVAILSVILLLIGIVITALVIN